ncbi:Leukotoxin export protein LtxD [Curvibacter sp. AEP1-3]|uniref:HlyD family type I secretion periplasmic adaptor subunit n=1 Tax=Curvibacter sp. AEP1-3 TaxID=1844971 RepID=UPI000B3D0ED8|nr:HlyD family type I secretion periplasmic adaptor subunit [Curvibacter sp. AEP1-3]ARV18643.1 Leukotoxin export protein LtxD [Curvibacter sp. AEP1-3]
MNETPKSGLRERWHSLKAWFRRYPLEVLEGGDVHTFSPAMLELQVSPPAPLARSIAWTIVVALLCSVLWSIWAEFDITVSAIGSAVPSDKTKTIQALEVGRIVAIHVKEGQAVTRDQVLMSLDATLAAADRQKTGQDTLDAQLDVARLKAQLAGKTELLDPPKSASAWMLQRQTHLLTSRVAEQSQKLAVMQQEIARKSADFATTQATIKKLEDAIPMLLQRLDMREKLFKEGYFSEMSVIEGRLEVSTQRNELAVLYERLKESASALHAAQLARKQSQAEYISKVSAELSDAQRRLQVGEQEFVKASYRESYQELRSPIDGTVQQLALNTVGGVVNATQNLMTLVPVEGGVEVQANVLNKDVGFLRVGMPVTVKLDAFEFTKYGVLEGKVVWIAEDAVKNEQLGQVFPVKISLNSTRLPMTVNGQHPEIRIGMSVVADIGIGTRKAYEYFLGPLLRYKNESLRER